MTMAWRLAIMDRGRLVQVGKPKEIYESPNCRMSAEFIGSVNIFEGNLMEKEGTTIQCDALPTPIQVEHPVSANAGMALMVAVRPEKIALTRQAPSDADNACQGVVEDIAYLGGQSIYHVRLPSGIKVIATRPNVDRLRNGQPVWEETVWLSWQSDAGVVLTV